MFFRKNKNANPRYVARALDWKPLFGVETGVVDDTRPDEPSTLDRSGAGFKYVTTYSNAKRIARWANKWEGR